LSANRLNSGLDEKDVAWVTGELFGAGFETTSSTLQYFAVAMTLFPDVARRAQREVDAVVGYQRTPTFEDQNKLPYVTALIRETMRWRPVVPSGLLHEATEDIYYEGYVIPKGSTLIGAIWSLCRDPEVFPDFDCFAPERFLDSKDSTTLKLSTDSGGRFSDFGFGFGRRICVGKDVALNALFISVATLLWAFEFKGQSVTEEADPSFTTDLRKLVRGNGVTISPERFKCQLVPRSQRVRDILAKDKYIDRE